MDGDKTRTGEKEEGMERGDNQLKVYHSQAGRQVM